MTRHQLAIHVEEVQPAIARGCDDIAQRGRVRIRQEVQRSGAAIDADKGRGHQHLDLVLHLVRRRVRPGVIAAGTRRQNQQAGAYSEA